MKLIFLIATLLIFSIVNGALIEKKKNLARTLAPEELALELEYLGSCQEFRNQVLSTIRISNHRGCLPIQVNVTENPDYDDLHSHWFCTNKDEDRSVIHFVEIFDASETTAVPNFVVSLVPAAPFRVLTDKTSLQRRPNCWVTNDYCVGDNAVVNNCKSNEIAHKERKHHGRERKFIVSHDRIYITSNQQVSNDCKTSVTECCDYIRPSIFGGICEHEAPTDRLEFPKEHEHKKGKGGKKGGKPQGGRPGQGHGGRPGQHGKSEEVVAEQQGKDVQEEEVAPIVKEVAPIKVKQAAPAPVSNEDEGEDDSEEQRK